MSRGPGRAQRAVLDAVRAAEGGWVSVDDVLGPLPASTLIAPWNLSVEDDNHRFPYSTLRTQRAREKRQWQWQDAVEHAAETRPTHAERESVRRAMHTLAATGRVELDHCNERRPALAYYDARPRKCLVVRLPLTPDQQVAEYAADLARLERLEAVIAGR